MRACIIVLTLIISSTSARSQSENVPADQLVELGWQSLLTAWIRDMPMRSTPPEYNKAIEYFERAVSLEPSSVDSYIGLAIANNRLEQYEQALRAIQHALDIQPDQAGARNEMGIALYGLCRYDEAIASLIAEIRMNDEYQKGLIEKPNQGHMPMSSNFVNHMRLGRMHSELGDLQQAREEYNQAASLNPTDSAPLYFLCLTYIGLRDKEAASREYDLFAELCADGCEGSKETLLEGLVKLGVGK